MISALIGVLIAVNAVFLIMALFRYPILGIYGLLVTFLLRALKINVEADVLGIAVTLQDAVSGLLLLSVILRLALNPRSITRDRRTPFIMAFGLLLIGFASLFRGMPEFGFPSAVNDFRSTLHVTAAVLYCLTVPLSLGKSQWQLFGVLGILEGIALYHWGLIGAGLAEPTAFASEAGASSIPRSLNSQQAVMIGQIMLMAWLTLRDHLRGWQRLILLAAPVFVLLLQHRSVWLAVVAGGLVLALQSATVRRRLTRWGLGLGVALALILPFIPNVTAPLRESLSASITETQSDESTFAWRLAGWQAILGRENYPSDTDYVIGKPYGTSWERQILGIYTTSADPHNWYITLLARVGAIGLTLWLGLIVWAAVQLARARTLEALAWLAVLVTQAVYGTAYLLWPEQGLMMGLTLLAALSLRADHRAVSSVGRKPVFDHEFARRGVNP